MKHRRAPHFIKAFANLPPEIKEQARKAFLLFREDSVIVFGMVRQSKRRFGRSKSCLEHL